MEALKTVLSRLTQRAGLVKDEEGQTLIEYVLVLVLVVLVLIAAYQASGIASAIENALSTIAATM